LLVLNPDLKVGDLIESTVCAQRHTQMGLLRLTIKQSSQAHQSFTFKHTHPGGKPTVVNDATARLAPWAAFQRKFR
jgi:hypothetical protein